MSFRLSSSAFKDKDFIPPWYARPSVNSSPPLGWADPPSGTSSFALIVTCADRETGREYCHWVVYNIPGDSTGIQGKQPHGSVFHDGSLQGVNSFGGVGWDGPDETIPDQELNFKLYALDSRLSLPGGASHSDVLEALEGHVLGTATLKGRYSPR